MNFFIVSARHFSATGFPQMPSPSSKSAYSKSLQLEKNVELKPDRNLKLKVYLLNPKGSRRALKTVSYLNEFDECNQCSQTSFSW
jgi:hypothetical protein